MFFNKNKAVLDEITKERKCDQVLASELIAMAKDVNLPFNERLDAFMKVPCCVVSNISFVCGDHKYFSKTFDSAPICINGRVRTIRVDDLYRDELFEIANTLYDAQEFVWIDGYKRVNLDMTLKYGNLKYDIGFQYLQHEVPSLCNRGFHFCYNAEDTEQYYSPSESVLLKVRAYVPVSEKEHSFDMYSRESNKGVCKKIQIIERADMEKEFPDGWADKLYNDISSYHYFVEDLESNLESKRKLKERFKNNPLETVMDYSNNTLKYYYGDSLATLIFTILNANVPQKRMHIVFDFMIRYAETLVKMGDKINATETISTLKIAIDLMI